MATKKGHRKGAQIAQSIYRLAHECVTFEPNDKVAALSVKHCVTLLRSTEEATTAIITQMNELAKKLPEYEVVKKMKGVGDKIAPRLIAEIGDVRRFKNAKSLLPMQALMRLLINQDSLREQIGIYLSADLEV